MYKSITVISAAVAASAEPHAAVPVIPDQFFAVLSGNTTGNMSGIPYGYASTAIYYDYTNLRQRKDFDDGTSKIYDYKTLVDPGQELWPKFPSPQGFKFRTDDINNTCCWLWLVDRQTNEAETMEQITVESNAKDVGTTPQGEHWSSVKKFPFLQTDDWWFKNNTPAIQNSYFIVPGHTSASGYVMSNTTWTKVQYGAAGVPPAAFAHPDSRPTFGKCGQCGKDPSCPMYFCMN